MPSTVAGCVFLILLGSALSVAEGPGGSHGPEAGPSQGRVGPPSRSGDALDEYAIRLAKPSIFINGERVYSETGRLFVTGPLVMLYLPSRGAFFFSREAQLGYDFEPVASVDGARLTFVAQGESFECETAAPIVPDRAAEVLWMLHDPSYTPRHRWAGSPRIDFDRVFVGAAGSYAGWLNDGPR
jgi:hypothetical protein